VNFVKKEIQAVPENSITLGRNRGGKKGEKRQVVALALKRESQGKGNGTKVREGISKCVELGQKSAGATKRRKKS